MSDGRIHGYGQQNRPYESRSTPDEGGIPNFDAPFFALPQAWLSPEVRKNAYDRITAFVHRSVNQLLQFAERECGERAPGIREKAAALKKLIEPNILSPGHISPLTNIILDFQKAIYEVRGIQCPTRLSELLDELKIYEENEIAV